MPPVRPDPGLAGGKLLAEITNGYGYATVPSPNGANLNVGYDSDRGRAYYRQSFR